MSKMSEIRIEKVTLNIGAGKDQKRLEKSMKLMKKITNINPNIPNQWTNNPIHEEV